MEPKERDVWQAAAELSEAQREAVLFLEDADDHRVGRLPKGIMKEVKRNERTTKTFYRQRQQQLEEETVEVGTMKYTRHLEKLKDHEKRVSELLTLVGKCQSLVSSLQEQQSSAAKKTVSLHEECSALQKQQEQYSLIAEGLRSRLRYFQAYDELSRLLLGGGIEIGSEEYEKALQSMDESIHYLATNIHLQDARLYLQRLQKLQKKVLGMLRDKVVARLSELHAQLVKREMGPANDERDADHDDHDDGGAKPSNDEIVVDSVDSYVAFRAAGEDIQRHIEILEKNETKKDCGVFIRSVFEMFSVVRMVFVRPVMEKRMKSVMKEMASASNGSKYPFSFILRKASVEALDVCMTEIRLISHYFAVDKRERELEKFVDEMAQPFLGFVRPFIVQEVDTDVLVDCISILRHEILDSRVRTWGRTAFSIESVVKRLLHDVQERLILRSEIFLNESVFKFRPSPEELQYPDILKRKKDEFDTKSVLTPSGSSSSAMSPSSSPKVSPLSSPVASGRRHVKQQYWYPTFTKTAHFLEKMYASLDRPVFENLAYEAVNTCVASFFSAGQRITSMCGPLDGHLFLVRHLLGLREHMSLYRINFIMKDKNFDFSHLVGTFGELLRGETSILSVTTSFGDRMRIMESESDSRRDIERELKRLCEEVIMECSQDLVESLMTLVSKASAIQRTKKTTSQAQNIFIHSGKVHDVLENVLATLRTRFPQTTAKFELYLPDTASRNILLAPIQSNIVDAFRQLERLLIEHGISMERVRSSEIGLPAMEGIRALLEGKESVLSHVRDADVKAKVGEEASSEEDGKEEIAIEESKEEKSEGEEDVIDVECKMEDS
eukprot:TRINITY_DN81032_c0_g1_i1.p1 TRINITY_DN81032_c0_g1~~TRINITY_DN81032_c0_g1_i1.p1  ORF type:complete len:838 (-),score=295.50 TRINITY_DN81032_c0_g1_i1:43-2556(-)